MRGLSSRATLILPHPPHSETPKALAHLRQPWLCSPSSAFSLPSTSTASSRPITRAATGSMLVVRRSTRASIVTALLRRRRSTVSISRSTFGRTPYAHSHPCFYKIWRLSLPVLVLRTSNGSRLGLPRQVSSTRRSPASRRVADRITSMRPLAADTSLSSVSEKGRLSCALH